MYFRYKLNNSENYIIDTYSDSSYITSNTEIESLCGEISIQRGFYTLVSIIDNSVYRVAYVGSTGDINTTKISRESMLEFIDIGVINAICVGGEVKCNKGIHEKLKTNKNFKHSICKREQVYRDRSKTLGQHNKFIYVIEGSNVILKGYDGDTKRVVVPDFITSIGNYAFYNMGIEEIVLPNNLRHIGVRSFSKNNLKYLEIPEGVGVISHYTVKGNSKLEKDIKNKLIIKNKNAIILE